MPIVIPSPILGKGSGETDVILVGSGTSQPGGVESYFEYNGLSMNNRANIDTFILTNMDGLSDADIRDHREINPEYHGETAFNSYYGGRTMAITGKIRTFNITKLRDMQEALRQAFGALQELPLRIGSNFSNYDVEIMCKKNQPLAMAESQQNNMFTRDFLITLRASDPRYRSVIQSVNNGVKTGGDTSFLPLPVVNEGNHRAQPYVTITGPITNPVLTNVDTGEDITYTGTVSGGSTMLIDVLNRTITDGVGVNKYAGLSVNSEWIEINPGTNILELTGTGITSQTSLSVVFKHTWL